VSLATFVREKLVQEFPCFLDTLVNKKYSKLDEFNTLYMSNVKSRGKSGNFDGPPFFNSLVHLYRGVSSVNKMNNRLID